MSTSGILPDGYHEGQSVEISGVIQPPKGPLADGLFDYRKYLRRLGIYYQLQVRSTNDWRVLPTLRPQPLADRFLAWAQTALARERTAAEYRETVEACLDTAQQMRRLTDSLLELARLDEGHETAKREHLDLAEKARGLIARTSS